MTLLEKSVVDQSDQLKVQSTWLWKVLALVIRRSIHSPIHRCSWGCLCSCLYFKIMISCFQKTSGSLKRVEHTTIRTTSCGTRITRLTKSFEINHDHSISKRYFWTGSETVIKWLNSESSRYTQFVSCRIGKILENCNIHKWNWIDSKSNVAYLAINMKIPEVSIKKPWFMGLVNAMANKFSENPGFNHTTDEEFRLQHVGLHETIGLRIETFTRL